MKFYHLDRVPGTLATFPNFYLFTNMYLDLGPAFKDAHNEGHSLPTPLRRPTTHLKRHTMNGILPLQNQMFSFFLDSIRSTHVLLVRLRAALGVRHPFPTFPTFPTLPHYCWRIPGIPWLHLTVVYFSTILQLVCYSKLAMF